MAHRLKQEVSAAEGAVILIGKGILSILEGKRWGKHAIAKKQSSAGMAKQIKAAP